MSQKVPIICDKADPHIRGNDIYFEILRPAKGGAQDDMPGLPHQRLRKAAHRASIGWTTAI